MKATITFLFTLLSFGYAHAQNTAKLNFFVESSQPSSIIIDCPTPSSTITQPSCTVPFGSIVFTSPLNAALPTLTDLFISEVTDEDVGALSYIEIYNGTGVTKNLANYKLKVYSNGNATATCDLALSGSLATGAVFVVSMGSTTNVGGVFPNMIFPACTGVNNNDAITLTSSTNTLIDLWGRTDGVIFTPANNPGYTYRRSVTAVHPKTTWDSTDWTALDPQNYTDVGVYDYQSQNYQYSIDGTNYQTSPNFSNVAPGTYQATVKDVSLGCVSSPVQVIINVAPLDVPIFTPLAPICSGGSTPFLPSVSLNGIVGSWSPSGIDNEVSSVYTFTPSIGQCATSTTLFIVVNPSPIVTTPPTLFECGIGVTNQAYFDLSINESMVTGGIAGVSVLYYTTLADALVPQNQISNPSTYLGTDNETIYIRVDNITGCFSTTSQLLRVTQGPIAITPQPLHYCDSNNDGFGTFDLESTIAEITGGSLPAGVAVSFYETATDALIGAASSLISPYQNIEPNTQTIYVRVYYPLTGCSNYVQLQLIVEPMPNPTLISNNTLNTVYVDGSNTVVQPLLLDCQLTGNYSYQWQVDGITIPNATSSTYLVDTATLNGESRVFTVLVTNVFTGCFSSSMITVEQSSGVPSPIGAITQTFNPGDTLDNLTVVGQNILWYSSAANKNVTSTPLPLNTLLVDGTTYYASQTIGGIESIGRLPVTATIALGLISIKNSLITIFPNPAHTLLNLQVSANLTIDKIVITDLTGKIIKVQTQNSNTINIENLAQGTYIVEAYSSDKKYSSKFIKE